MGASLSSMTRPAPRHRATDPLAATLPRPGPIELAAAVVAALWGGLKARTRNLLGDRAPAGYVTGTQLRTALAASAAIAAIVGGAAIFAASIT